MKVYSPEKTLADCFKYRNKIGLDVVLETLKFYRRRKRLKVDELMRCARVCRMEKVMRPYLEATLDEPLSPEHCFFRWSGGSAFNEIA